jgi:DNA polymerase-3 subunit delta
MDSLTFLDEPADRLPLPVYVLHGDEDFLKRQVLAALRVRVLGPAGDDFGLSTYDGDKAIFAVVHDELETLPFLGPYRLVVVSGADPFVTRYRAALEKFIPKPPATGVLVLDVKSWPATTRLAKLVDQGATIACKSLPAGRLPSWCVHWAAARHGKQLRRDAAQLLVDLVGSDMGQLEQELAKLAVYAGAAAAIEARDVDQLVGSSREENTWKIFDAIAQGRPAEALAILDRLFEQGEEPLRILGAFSMQLRRLAQAARLTEHGHSLNGALEQVGVSPYNLKGAQQQIRHLGRRRVDRLYDWLLEVDLGLKGSSQLPPRALLERLVIRLARPNESAPQQRTSP